MLTLLALIHPNKKICNGCYADLDKSQGKPGNKIGAVALNENLEQRPPGTRRCCLPTSKPNETPDVADCCGQTVDSPSCQNVGSMMQGDVMENKNTSADRAPGGHEGPNPYAPYAQHQPQPQYANGYPQYQQPQYYPPPGYSVQEGHSVPYQNPQTHIIYVIPPQEHAYTHSSQTTVVVPPGQPPGAVYVTQPAYIQPGQQILVVSVKPLEDPRNRALFIRKVYSILLVQLILTTVAVSCSLFIPMVKTWITTHFYWIYVFLFLYLACVILMCCLTPYMLSTNCISVLVLITITIAMAGVISFTTVTKAQETILIATAVTTACVLVLTIIAFASKYDFTQLYSIVTVFFLIIVLFGILAAFLHQHIPILKLVYAVLGALIMCMYIIMDTQMLMGGKHQELDTNMYIFGAIMLYIDILVLFLYILDITESSS